jgi:hypothetical protein
MPRGIWRQLAVFAASFAVLFSVIALAEYWFARNRTV